MRRSRWARWLVALLAATLSLGCTQTVPTPVPAFVSATPTAAATLASSPTPPRSPTPTPTPTPEEPWIVGRVPLYHLPGQGIEPRAIAATEGRLYVANAQSANLSVIEGGQVVATIAAGAEPIALAADRAGRVYVLDGRESQLLVIEGAAVVQRWTIPPGSGSLAVVGDALWVGTGDGRLLALSPEGGSELGAISLSQNAPVLRIVPDLADARWAAAVTYGRIHRVDLNLGVETAVAEIGIWRALAYSHDGAHLYAGVYRAEADEHHLLKLTASDLALLDEYGRLAEAFERRGGYEREQRMAQVMAGLELDDLPRDPVAGMDPVIARAIAVKIAVVNQDRLEHGPRAYLNLGHTFAHAIEQVSGYAWKHGQAVAVGMVAAARLAERRGVARAGLAGRVEVATAALGLPVSLAGLEPADLWDAMGHDKKWRDGAAAFVLLEEVGRPVIARDVPRADVLAVLDGLREDA